MKLPIPFSGPLSGRAAASGPSVPVPVDGSEADSQLHIDATMATLRRLVRSDELRESERAAVADDLADIAAMLQKLEAGVVEIAAFGEINSGKSSLLNALLGRPAFAVSAQGGRTRERQQQEWTPSEVAVPGLGASKLVVVDTPGINEVDGLDQAALAHKTVRYADLVLFVTFGDLNEIEFTALKALHELDKPIIVVLNKIDIFKRHELAEVLAAVRAKVAGLVGEADIVFAAGDPRPSIRIVTLPDGREQEEDVPRAPVIEDLQARILEVLQREGKAVVALNANLFAAEVSDRIAALKVEARKAEADTLITRFMWVKATAVALNPVPIADVAGGAVTDAIMVQKLGEVYGQEFSRRNAARLIKEIIGAWGIVATVEWATHLASGLMKGLAPLLGHAIVAVPQALTAAWTSYVVGQAASRYFRDGGWGPKGAKAIVREILSDLDRDSILSPLKDRLLARLESRKS
jgi:small GTP-binding protein